MATATKITSLDKVQQVAVENGWDVEVTKTTKTIKDPDPEAGNRYGNYRRRRYVPRIQAEVWQVMLDNTDALAGEEYEGISYGACVIYLYFTEDGKYLAELARSTGYHMYPGKPLREALNILEQLAPTKIQAHVLQRIADKNVRRAKTLADAAKRVQDAQTDLDNATRKAEEALLAVGVDVAMLDTALATLQGPLFLYGLCKEGVTEAKQAQVRVENDPYV